MGPGQRESASISENSRKAFSRSLGPRGACGQDKEDASWRRPIGSAGRIPVPTAGMTPPEDRRGHLRNAASASTRQANPHHLMSVLPNTAVLCKHPRTE